MEKMPIVRIQQIELKNFKNVENGKITMPSFLETESDSYVNNDVLGIYGQNGTGKTAIIDALEIVQTLLSGEKLKANVGQYISKGHEICTICVDFLIIFSELKIKVEYLIQLKQLNEENFIIDTEKLAVAYPKNNSFEAKRTLFNFSASNPTKFMPVCRYNELVKAIDKKVKSSNHEEIRPSIDAKTAIATNTLIAQRELRSAIFNQESRDLYNTPISESEAVAEYAIVLFLFVYARTNLLVVSNYHNSEINSKRVLPLSYTEEVVGFSIMKSTVLKFGSDFINNDSSVLIELEKYDRIIKLVKNLNQVMPSIVPTVQVEVRELGRQTLSNGGEGIRIQLLSKRGDITIPLLNESAGIIKIISMLNSLVHVYNNPSACLAIDELDSGVFEYLLGELLSIFKKNAQGQIIFTSHNLRLLELLDKSNIMFSTANPKNRYIRFRGVKSNNNLRDLYLRSIVLGGQSEELYIRTDASSIAHNLKKAGESEV